MNSKSCLSKLYPVSKLTAALVIALTGVLIQWDLFGYVVVLPLLFILAAADGKLKSFFVKMYGMLVFLAITIFLIKGLFHPSEDILFSFWIIKIKTEGARDALRLISRVISIAGALLLFFETTDLEDFMVSLVKLGMPYTAAYIFLSTLQIVPDLIKRSKTIMQAQRARGIETEGNVLVRTKAFIPVISPLIISSITEIEDRVITLESRAFSVKGKRIFLVEPRAGAVDYMIGGVFLLAFVIFLWMRYFA
ncbi:hypothetical protein B4O97_12025 [Marispirochaeta aestuarii]|uniref:Cobalt transporter n=1 Tax=Marispirochaeta aestuarii TaxID=1963862 RepID=A0A1Y1RWX2_9SPIO|nr:energy-coupling factor transporter transmembrane component T [Marispirochaeta aestuarii]ORC34668.1 hypothetical protein B4O97_12025 [Marispirochaeta aestuarii]